MVKVLRVLLFTHLHKKCPKCSKIIAKVIYRNNCAKINLIPKKRPWDRAQTGIKLGRKHVIYQSWHIFCGKRISMLTFLKMSALACKHSYKPEHNAKREPHEIGFSSLRKMESCAFIMFTPRNMII